MLKDAGKRGGRLEWLQSVFMRVVALVFIALALHAWMRVTGFSDGGDYRFDAAGDHWRLASAVLCVLLPVAALGLWSGQPWGAVLWVAAASVAVAMHVLLPALYGRADLLVAFHLAGLATLSVFRLAIVFLANKK